MVHFGAGATGWAGISGGANLTPGWHVVGIVYTKGFFAVYYEGHQYTRYTSAKVTWRGAEHPAPQHRHAGFFDRAEPDWGSPVNSDSSAATVGGQVHPGAVVQISRRHRGYGNLAGGIRGGRLGFLAVAGR